MAHRPSDPTSSSRDSPADEPKQVICMKWGNLYGPQYVNTLYSMVRRHVTGDLQFVCLTDDAEGIRQEVRCLPCPEAKHIDPSLRNKGWRKLTLWQKSLFDLSGEFLFLDLDVVIVDSIDELFTWGEGFCVQRNWSQPRHRIGNTSVYRYRIGAHPEVWQNVVDDPRLVTSFPNSQTYISRTVPQMSFWPEPWCALFKVHCVPRSIPGRWLREPVYPPGTKIVAFPGVPNPPEAMRGEWPARWYKKFYKHIRPARWIEEHWRP